jgi:hypothetical protein
MAPGEAGHAGQGRLTDLAMLAAFPSRLAASARTAADRPVAAGEWTVEQVVRHLIAVEWDVHQGRLRDVATSSDPMWDWTEPGPWTGEPSLDLDGALERFAAARDGTLAMLSALDEAGWARTGHHTTFGVLDVAGLVRNAVDHDAEHLAGLVDPPSHAGAPPGDRTDG